MKCFYTSIAFRLLIAGLALLLTVSAVRAQTTIRRVVISPTGGIQDGSSWENAMTLQAALAASTTPGDQIWIAGGTYKPHATDRTATFSVPAGVLVYGGFDPTTDNAIDSRTGGETILSGDLLSDDGTRPAAGAPQADVDAYNATRDDNSNRAVVTITGANVVLDGLTMRGGGGGLYSDFANTTLVSCAFTSNEATFGGGANFSGEATLTGCTFTDNVAEGDVGGGAAFYGRATLTDCTFMGNVAEATGGGAYFAEEATLTGCTFTDNEADFSGGAYIEGIATLTGCTFTDNEADFSGGASFSSVATLTNCVAVGNSAAVGGGIGVAGGSTVINSTFYNNTATERGGGIFVFYFDIDPDMVGVQTNSFNLQNSILIGNTATIAGNAIYLADAEAPLSATGIEATIDRNLIGGGMADFGTGLLDQDDDTETYTDVPFADATNVTLTNTIEESDATVVFASTDAMNTNYLRLRTGSPAVGAGNNDYVNNATPRIMTDAAGDVRIQGGTVDMGAYESAFAAPTPQIIDFTLANTGTVGDKIDLTAAADSGLEVTFTSSDETVAAIGTGADAGKLVLKAEGTTIITASQDGDDTYAAATDVTQTITVEAAGTQTPTTHTGDVFVTTQAEVDALHTSLTAGVTRIEGSVTIGPATGASDITDLSPLAAITEITGNVVVQNNPDLPNLVGLNQLQTIGSFFSVSDNTVLTSLGNFSTLQSIGSLFSVSSNASLTSLGNFSTLQSIGGGFSVFSNATLTSLGDFSALQSIGGVFSVFSNDELTSLGNFTTLQSIGGHFWVFSNDELTSLGNFSTLQTIGDDFYVSNDDLTSLGDFTALQSIGGAFRVSSNDELTSLGAFPMLASIGSSDGIYIPSTDSQQDGVSIVVERNNRLQDCCVLTEFLSGAANAVSGQVFIGNNAQGCSSTTEVNCDPFLQVGQKIVFVAKTATEGTLEIFSTLRWQLNKPDTGADWITNIAADGGNNDASSITGENDASIAITITVNPNDVGRSTTLTLTAIDIAGNALTDPASITIPFTQLGGIAHVGDVFVTTQAEVNALTFPANATAIQGNVTIGPASGTSDITDLSPLVAITEITGNVLVRRNPDLTNLMGLNQLQTIGGGFWVLNNADLTSLGDFSALRSIGRWFDVEDNASLTSLGDFSALESIGSFFQVSSTALTSMGDFSTLETIGGSFLAFSNASLTSLGDFTALQSIGGSFYMSNNDELTSLGAFPMLASIGSVDEIYIPSTDSRQDGVSIVVENNDRLQDCCVLTEFLSGAANAVSGQVFIGNNASGCSSTTQVNCDPFLQVGQKVVFVAKTATEGTLEIFSTLRWQLSKPDTEAEWITNIAADGGNSNASSITGENDASIAITTTANPDNARRSTTLTLRAIDIAGNALTDPDPVTIPFTQLGIAHIGDVFVTTQAEINALTFPANAMVIQGNVTIETCIRDERHH